jgi:UDP-N-acetylmuramoyl-tripeptide--D-alanyl-D-alanine ligase
MLTSFPLVGPILALVFLIAWLRPLGLTAWRALHLLQLEEYQTARYLRWAARNWRAALDPWLLTAGALGALGGALLPAPLGATALVAGAAVGAVQTGRRSLPPAKKPLVLTARARRLLGGAALIAVIWLGLVGHFGDLWLAAIPWPLASATALAVGLLGVVAWPLPAAANLLLYPVEAGFRAYYLRSARRVLRSYRPVVVGVAGSYGKTSTKTILAQLLATAYPTLATPRSFNTPMGLCRVIREQLQPEHRFFIAELGAYQRGEIRQLAQLVRPTIGILTAVGPEHLERFGSLDNVIQAESEILEALPADGLAIVNGSDPTCRTLAAKAQCRTLLVAAEPDSAAELWADATTLDATGLRFTLCHRDGRRAAVQTQLLGRPNVTNLLAACAAALACGLPFEALPAAIAGLTPVEHRLQLVPNPNGVTVIDDTYNSNPRGAAAALETLASFQGGRRYLVTPGMVELGELRDPAHRDFGRQAAAVCDAVILIGPRQTGAIAEGLAAAGFAPDRLIVTRSLDEATERLRGLLQRGDAVLFENDLPDNYAE